MTAVEYYLAHATVVVVDVEAEKAIEKFKERRTGRGNQVVTADITASILRKFVRDQKITRVSEMSAEKVKAFIFDTSIEVRTRRDRYDLLHNFSVFLIDEKHLAKNLTEGIDRPKVTNDGEVAVFKVAQCQALLDAAAAEPCSRQRIKGAMLPYFASCMLSGMRPDEVKRMKPDWSNFSFENGVITGFRAKKKQTRTVAMHDQLPGILEKCKAAGLAPGYFSRKAFEKIQRAAGVKSDGEESAWDNDILRHCYGSHHYPLHNDLGFLIKNMGNSEDVLKQSYLNFTVLAKEGAAYFQMKPASMVGLGEKVPRVQVKRHMLEAAAEVQTTPAAIAAASDAVANDNDNASRRARSAAQSRAPGQSRNGGKRVEGT
jgi:integrase